MTKILNIDSLAPTAEERVLSIDGANYPIEEMSVETFLLATSLAKKLEGAPIDEQVVATVDLICRLVPSLPRDKLVKYKLPVLSRIAKFVQGEDEPEQGAEAAPGN
jgi:hypothetical protein